MVKDNVISLLERIDRQKKLERKKRWARLIASSIISGYLVVFIGCLWLS